MENIVQGQWFRGPSADLGEPINQSLRFNSSGYLKRAQSAPLLNADRTFTFSTWFKHGDMGETQIFGIHQASSDNWLVAWTSGASYDTFLSRDYTGWQQYDSTQKFRDPNAWYHIFLTCSSGVMTMKVNNVARGGTVTQNHSMDRDFVLGAENNGGSTPMDAYLAETYFIQGTVLHPVNDGFIRLNADGVYVPDTPTISSYGTNGWHLTYDSSQTNGIGHDSSGNGNHFTATGFDTAAISSSNPLSDVDYLDTPTRNFATWNPLKKHGTTANVLSQGNLHAGVGASRHGVTIAKKISGKDIYFELDNGYGVSSSFNWNSWWNAILLHNGPLDTDWSGIPAAAVGNGFMFDLAADVYANNVNETQRISDASNTNTIYGVKITDTQITLTKDGNATNVTNLTFANSFDKGMYIYGRTASTTTNENQRINFGQQDFLHEPSNVTKLEVNEIAEPTIKNGKEHFDIYTYTSASTAADITFTGWEFQPDLVWFKCTSHGSSHRLYDSVRGVNKGIQSNTLNAEGTDTDALNSFDSNGFSLGTGNSDINYDSRSFVAWGWKAGGTAVSNTNGTITSSVSANTDAGFSIISYTGNGTGGATIGHGLTQVPEFVIVKRRAISNSQWYVYHGSIGNQSGLNLNSTVAQLANSSGYWNNTSPTNQVISLGNFDDLNKLNNTLIAYAWHSVEGYSKIGKYTGNGNTDGTFIYTGFSPAFIMYKKVNGVNSWHIIDNKRDTSNPARTNLFADDALAEDTTYIRFDFLSNGFKQRTSYDANNVSGGEYIYMAFAENPFGGENVPPATAR